MPVIEKNLESQLHGFNIVNGLQFLEGLLGENVEELPEFGDGQLEVFVDQDPRNHNIGS